MVQGTQKLMFPLGMYLILLCYAAIFFILYAPAVQTLVGNEETRSSVESESINWQISPQNFTSAAQIGRWREDGRKEGERLVAVARQAVRPDGPHVRLISPVSGDVSLAELPAHLSHPQTHMLHSPVVVVHCSPQQIFS